jgi:hypothetical protein
MKKILLSLILLISIVTPITVLAETGEFVTPLGSGSETPDEDRNGFLNDTTLEVLGKFQEATKFRSFTGRSNPNGENKAGLDSLTGILYTVIDIIKYAAGILAVVGIMIAIFQMVTAGSDKSEEEYAKVKNSLVFSVMAVIVVISIDFFFQNVFVVDSDNFLSSTRSAQQFALAGASEIRGIYNLIQAALATIAVLYLVVAGFRLVANATDEEAVARLKRQAGYGAAGLILVAVSEFVVKDIIFMNGGTGFSVSNANLLIVNFTNFFAGFIGLVAFLSLIYAGYLYVVSGVAEDNTEQIKKIAFGAVIGILIAAGSFAIVNTVVKLDSSEAPQTLQNQLDTFAR